MRFESLIVAGCLLFSAGPMPAQSGAGTEEVSGTWTGSMGTSESTRTPVTVTLKVDGPAAITGTVTGPQLTPGDIKSGTFDAQTRVLKFTVVVRGEGSIVEFEGLVIQGTAMGRVRMPDQSGTFKLAKGADEAAPVSARPDPASEELRRSFAEVSGYVTKAAALVPADKYGHRPAPSVRTFGQLIGHIADSYVYYCSGAAGRDIQWSDAIEKGSTDKAALAAKLKQSLEVCTPAYGGSGKVGGLIDNLGHTNLHYGNIITYMRTLGLAPPSS